MEEKFEDSKQPNIMVPVGDLDTVEVKDGEDVDALAQELATIRQSAKRIARLFSVTMII